jgi:hypothetical protein
MVQIESIYILVEEQEVQDQCHANWSVSLDKTGSAPGPNRQVRQDTPQLPATATCMSSMGLAGAPFTPPAQM